MAETAGATVALGKGLHQFEANLPHGHHHELGDTLRRLNTEGCLPAIPAGNQKFSLVIGIDQTDEVSQDDTVFMAKPGAGQYHRCQTRIVKMDRQPRVYQFAGPWRELQRFIQARAQIDAGRTSRTRLRKRNLPADTRIENLELNALEGTIAHSAEC